MLARVPAPSSWGTPAPYVGATIASAAAAAAAAASGETLLQSEGKALQQLDRRLYALTHPSDRRAPTWLGQPFRHGNELRRATWKPGYG